MGVIENIKSFLSKLFTKDENQLVMQLTTCNSDLTRAKFDLAQEKKAAAALSTQIANSLVEYMTLKSEFEKLALSKDVEIETPLEKEINEKYKKIRVKYGCRVLWTVKKDGTFGKDILSLDIMDFWDINNQDVQNIATMIRATNKAAWEAEDWDTLVWHAEKWVKDHVKYTGDINVQKVAEYWQFVYETLHLRTADCEDGAWLIANIVAALLPPQERFRIHFCVGPVKGGKHGYTSYRRFKDNRSVILDWCYWPTNEKIPNRSLHTDKQDYYGVDFSASTKFCFSKIDYKGDALLLVENL